MRRNGPWIGFKEFFFFFSNVLCSHSLSASFIYFRGMHANDWFDRGQVNDTVRQVGGDGGREKECRKVGEEQWAVSIVRVNLYLSCSRSQTKGTKCHWKVSIANRQHNLIRFFPWSSNVIQPVSEEPSVLSKWPYKEYLRLYAKRINDIVWIEIALSHCVYFNQ